MDFGIEPLDRLVEEFRSLDGVGRKTAARLAFSVLSMTYEEAAAFAEAILAVKTDVHACSVCCNITAGDVCSVCADRTRDRSTVAVVEDARAVAAIERVRDYHGLYHVLGGTLSLAKGVAPDRLSIQKLLERVAAPDSEIKEIIIATNPDMEGEATAMYIARALDGSGVKVTRLANGVPVGGDLEYADSLTLARALQGRRELI